MNTADTCAVIILAGGDSSRMGLPKPFLAFDEQNSFISVIATGYEKWGCNSIIAVLNHRYLSGNHPGIDRSAITVVDNQNPELGRMHSVVLGTLACEQDYVFIHNVDQPFFNPATLDAMWSKRKPNAVVIPVYREKGGHPVLLGKALLNDLRNTCTDDTLKEFLSHYLCKRTNVNDSGVVENINTPEDYRNRFQTDARLVSNSG